MGLPTKSQRKPTQSSIRPTDMDGSKAQYKVDVGYHGRVAQPAASGTHERKLAPKGMTKL